jgi:hypothetical protein
VFLGPCAVKCGSGIFDDLISILESLRSFHGSPGSCAVSFPTQWSRTDLARGQARAVFLRRAEAGPPSPRINARGWKGGVDECRATAMVR